MGWENYHTFEFLKGTKRFGMIDEDFEDDELLDAENFSLSQVISQPKDKLRYAYDFGDDWEHDIIAEKFLPKEKEIKYPVCIDGARNCPPEDCGGIPGYDHLLKVLANKRSKEHKEMLEWVGGSFNPEHFDLPLVNESLEDLTNE